MKTTNIKLVKISAEEMLEHPEKAYNPAIWRERVKSYLKYPKCQFYYAESPASLSYTLFYVSYVADGIYFLSEFHAFSACLSNAGFCMVMIGNDGTVYKNLFRGPDGREGYAENCKENRVMFRNRFTPNDIMVSTSF